MKTTVDVANSLFYEIRERAEAEGTTFRALLEEGLRKVLAERAERRRPFRLRVATFRGHGLLAGAAGGSWREWRALVASREAG